MGQLDTDRLDQLQHRLDTAVRRLEGAGQAGTRHRTEGEALRQRHAHLQARLRQGGAGTAVEKEFESLVDAVDRWVADVDHRFATAEPRTVSPKD